MDERKTDINADNRPDSQTDNQTDKQTDTQTDEAKAAQADKVETGSAGDKARAMAHDASERLRELTDSDDFRAIEPLTWGGLGLVLVFFVLMWIDTLMVRWWLMLPIGLGSLGILWKQRSELNDDRSLEGRLCLAGLWVIGFLLVARDILLPSAVMELALDELVRSAGALRGGG